MAWYDELGAGTLGAIDEALFGVPEWVAKQIDRKGVEDYIKSHEPAYRTGELIGTVGGAFIPVGGIAKGAFGAGKAGLAALKGVKAADTALDIAKAADTSKKALSLGQLAARGALTGAGEAGVRAFTSEKSLPEAIESIKSGAMFGAGGAAASNLLGKGLKKTSEFLKRNAGELEEGAEKAYLGLTDLSRRDTMSVLRDMSGKGAKGIGKLKKADSARQELVRVGKEIGAHIPGKADKNILDYAKQWDKLDEITEAFRPNIRASDAITEALPKVDFEELYKTYGKSNVDDLMKQMLDAGTDRTGLANVRKYLQDIVDVSYQPSGLKSAKDAGYQSMSRDLAKSLRSGIDENILEMAEQQGVKLDFNKMKRDYLPMRAFAESTARDAVTPTRFNTGSGTAEKLIGQSLLGAGAGYLGNPNEDIGQKALTGLAGGVLGAVGKKGAETLVRQGTAKLGVPASQMLAKLAEKLPEKFGKTAGKLADDGAEAIQAGFTAGAIPAAGEKLGQIASQAIAATDPQTEGQAEGAKSGAIAASGDKSAYMSNIESKLKQAYAMSGLSEEFGEDGFKEYASYVSQLTNGFSPDKMANVLYTDPEERKAYQKAYEVSQVLGKNLQGAQGYKQNFIDSIIPDFGQSEEQKIGKEQSYRALQSVLADAIKQNAPDIGGAEKIADKQLASIMTANATPEQKQQMLMNVLQGYGVNINLLQQSGVL